MTPPTEKKPAAHGRIRQWSINAALFAASMLLSLVIIELGLRYTTYGRLLGADVPVNTGLLRPHATRGWELIPNAEACAARRDFVTRVSINAKGLRDVDHAYDKPHGTFRILVLGDSFMMGEQVPLRKAFPRLLEDALSQENAEVVNAGVNGYSPVQELLMYRDEGRRYNADLVLLAFYVQNDTIESYRPLAAAFFGEDAPRVYSRPYPHAEDSMLHVSAPDYQRYAKELEAERMKEAENREPWLERLSLTRKLRALNKRRLSKWSTESPILRYHNPNLFAGVLLEQFDASTHPRAGFTNEEYTGMFDAAWQETQRVLVELDRHVRADGAQLAILVIPDLLQVEADFRKEFEARFPGIALDLRKPNREMKEFADAAGIPLIDPTDAFVTAYESGERPLYFMWDDNHWTAKGHRVAAAAAARLLREAGLILPSALL